MKRIKIAQIGTGHDHAAVTFSSLLRLPQDFQVVGVAECNPERMSALEQAPYAHTPHYTVEELLAMEDLEAVAVETDEELATAIAQRFAERGKAIHLDKPGSAGVSSFTRLIETARAQRLPFQMGYMYRYNPLIKRVLNQAKAGVLGEIYSVEAQMSVRHTPEKRRWLEKYQGGMFYFLGCHLVDLVLQLQGEPEQVIPLNTRTGMDGTNAEDLGVVIFKYPRGVSYIKSCASEFGGFCRRQLVVCGAKGTVEIKPLEINEFRPYAISGVRTLAVANYEDTETDAWRDCADRWDSGVVDRYDGMMHDFARIIRGEIENPYTLDYELKLFKLLMRCCGVEE